MVHRPKVKSIRYAWQATAQRMIGMAALIVPGVPGDNERLECGRSVVISRVLSWL